MPERYVLAPIESHPTIDEPVDETVSISLPAAFQRSRLVDQSLPCDHRALECIRKDDAVDSVVAHPDSVAFDRIEDFGVQLDMNNSFQPLPPFREARKKARANFAFGLTSTQREPMFPKTSDSTSIKRERDNCTKMFTGICSFKIYHRICRTRRSAFIPSTPSITREVRTACTGRTTPPDFSFQSSAFVPVAPVS